MGEVVLAILPSGVETMLLTAAWQVGGVAVTNASGAGRGCKCLCHRPTDLQAHCCIRHTAASCLPTSAGRSSCSAAAMEAAMSFRPARWVKGALQLGRVERNTRLHRHEPQWPFDARKAQSQTGPTLPSNAPMSTYASWGQSVGGLLRQCWMACGQRQEAAGDGGVCWQAAPTSDMPTTTPSVHVFQLP